MNKITALLSLLFLVCWLPNREPHFMILANLWSAATIILCKINEQKGTP